MNKFLTLGLVAMVALVANQALAQCASCASGTPVFNQGQAYSAPVNYSTQSYGTASYGTPIYNTPISYAPMSYAPSYSQPIYNAPISYSQPAPAYIASNYSQPIYSQPISYGTPGCGSPSYPMYDNAVLGTPVYSSGCSNCGMIADGSYLPEGTIISEGIVDGTTIPGTVIESPAGSTSEAASPSDESTPPVPTPEPENESPTPSPEPEDDSAATPVVGDDT